jgi:hypothetical protein
MSFLNAAFLLGLTGLSLPVIIHLLKRKKLQIIPWAAHRFLVASMKRNKQRIQFEDLLLLLLRCLFLALVVLAFARPVFDSGDNPAASAATGDSAQVVILLDNSASMGANDGVRSRLDEARELAEASLDSLPVGASVALFAYHDRVQPVIGRPTSDLALVRRELARIRPVSRGSDLAPALRAALDLLDTLPPAPRRVLVFGDRQRTAWTDQDTLNTLGDRAAESRVALSFRAPASEAPANLAVTRLEADAAEAVVGQPVRFFVEILNGGSQPASSVRLTLSPDGGPPAAEKLIPTLAPGERANVEFTLSFPQAGFRAVTARVPADALAFDDARTLALRVTDGVRVLLAEGPASPGSRVRPGFFLAEALAPVPAARKASFPVQVERVAPNELTAARLATARAVVLAGLPALTTETEAALDRFVRAGGGVWIFPAATSLPPAPAFAPAQFGPATDAAAAALTPSGPPYSHPIVNLWDDPANGGLDSISIRRHAPLFLGQSEDPAEASERVLRLSDGTPLLAARALGRGRVLQSAVPGDTIWSDLPLLPSFVPLVQRGLAYLQGGVAAPGAIAPDDAFTVRVEPALLGREFRVLAPGREGDPVAAGRVELIGGQPSIRYTATGEPGVYRLFHDNGADLAAVFAVNPDSSESDLADVDPIRISTLTREGAAGPAGSGSASGLKLPDWLARDFWSILAAAALLLVLGELFLAQRFSRAK